MKSRFTLLFALVITCMMALGQPTAIELTFKAVNNTTHVQLDSIKIMNRTQGGDTVLYWPDTVLNYPLGLTNLYEGIMGFQLYQNYPNPVGDQTNIGLSMPEQGQVNLMVTDMLGRIIYSRDMILSAGFHTFQFTPGKEALYFLSVTWQGSSKSIKILHLGPGDNQRCSLAYLGSTSLEPEWKSRTSEMDFIISPGDELLYVGYSSGIESGMLDIPEENTTYTFQFATNIPCPGMPTVDYEGQVYNTIQILSQCWLKENLNVGTMIPGDDEMTNNGVIEKYCYNNNPDSCTKYGGLYQWDEMMQYTTQQGAQGICPPGWHVPTDEEWKVLEGAVDSQYGIGDNIWDDLSMRGIDAGTNLKATSGWNENGNGTDLYGFSGLPGGSYQGGSFYAIGIKGYWWTSTETNYVNPHSAWSRILDYGHPGVYRYHSHYKEFGYSIRCFRDY